MINLKDYLSKQIRFSLGNIPSVPIGILLLYCFTQYLGIFYIYSSLLSMAVTTILNFWIQVLLKVIHLKN